MALTTLMALHLTCAPYHAFSPKQICFRNGHLFFTSGLPLRHKAYDEGGDHLLHVGVRDWIQQERHGSNVTMLPVDIILAWFTAVRNLHHMQSDTMMPIANALGDLLGDSDSSTRSGPFIAIGDTKAVGWGRNKGTPDNVPNPPPGWGEGMSAKPHTQYQQLLSVLPIQPTLLAYSGMHQIPNFRHMLKPFKLVDGSLAPTSLIKTTYTIDDNQTYCFRRLRIVKPYSKPSDDHMRNVWARMAACNISTVATECIIIQRADVNRRKILNIDDVVVVARESCDRVRVIKLEGLSLKEQVSIFRCPTRIISIGVHGAGLQWSLAISGHDPVHPQTGGVIEWGARKWGIPNWYRNNKLEYVYRTNPNVTYPNPENVSRSGHCDLVRDPGCHYPDKFANLWVDIPAFKSDLVTMMRNLRLK